MPEDQLPSNANTSAVMSAVNEDHHTNKLVKKKVPNGLGAQHPAVTLVLDLRP